jgi:hypothetical protein
MQKLVERKPFRNSELSNIFDARNFKLSISRFLGPSLAPSLDPMKPAEVARLLLQGQKENSADLIEGDGAAT